MIATNPMTKALKVLALLHDAAGVSVSAREIEQQLALPARSLEPVLRRLSQAGLVLSRRGKTHGYVLKCDPSACKMDALYRALHTPSTPSEARWLEQHTLACWEGLTLRDYLRECHATQQEVQHYVI